MQNLLWVDIETTGLDENDGVILEIAAAITDSKLKIKSFFHKLVKQPESFKITTFAAYIHAQNELISEILHRATYTIEEVDAAFYIWLNKHNAKGLYLAGSNPSFDRRWLNVHMPKSATIPHYRHFDMNTIYAYLDKNKNEIETHRAQADIERDISKLKEFRRMLEQKYIGEE